MADIRWKSWVLLGTLSIPCLWWCKQLCLEMWNEAKKISCDKLIFRCKMHIQNAKNNREAIKARVEGCLGLCLGLACGLDKGQCLSILTPPGVDMPSDLQ